MLTFEGNPIQVAVRICPQNDEKEKKAAAKNSAIQLQDSTTISVTNPEDSSEIRIFKGFSHCYWSCDGFTDLDPDNGPFVPDFREKSGPKYCDQKRIFENFGKEMVQNAYLGFNSSLICIGDEACGKSWTMFGLNQNKGLIPQFGVELFKNLKDKEKSLGSSPVANPIIEVKMTMMEVYDNSVKDLLVTINNTKYKTMVKVREHPKRGFYDLVAQVEGLRSVIISNADDLQQRIDEGQSSRASSCFNRMGRSAVIVGLSLIQKYRNVKGDEVTMSALIDFYDLPVSGSSNSGSNLKTINGYEEDHHLELRNNQNKKSPLPKSDLDEHLNKVVSALGNNSSISYSNSTVTKLLERGLSGNTHCKPPTCQKGYEKCLATLVLADKLKHLHTHPLINEEMTNKLTRELKMENDNLRRMLANGELGEKNEFFAFSDMLDILSNKQTSEEYKRQMIDDIKSQVKDNEREIKILNQTLDEKLKLAKLDRPNDSQPIKKLEGEKKHKPFIYNLNKDSQLVARLTHVISTGITEFGTIKGKEGTLVVQYGPGIREVHGSFSYNGKDNKVFIRPNGLDCVIKVNGLQIHFETQVYHNDRLTFGGSQLWLFQNPKEPWADKNTMSKISFNFAQEELALKSQFFCQLGESISSHLKETTIKLSPLIDDVNAMCYDLNKHAHFDLIVVRDIHKVLKQLQEEEDTVADDAKEVIVRLTLPKEEMHFNLSSQLFLEKYEMIKKDYIKNQEPEFFGRTMDSPINETQLIDVNTEVNIGYGLISFKPLVYLISFQEDAVILDFVTLTPLGTTTVEVIPCTAHFEKLEKTKSPFLTSSSELLGKPLNFMVKVGNVSKELSSRFKDITCNYQFHTEAPISTGNLDSKSLPQAYSQNKMHERRFPIKQVTPKLIESFENDLVVFTLYGRQRSSKMLNQFRNNQETTAKSSPYLGLIQKQKADLIVSKIQNIRIQQKMNTMQSMIDLSSTFSQTSISLDYLKKISNAKDEEDAIELINGYKEEFTPPQDEVLQKNLTTYQKVSEVCSIV